MTLLSLTDQLSAAQAVCDKAAVSKWLNCSVSIAEDAIIQRLGFEERHIGNPLIRALHGGVITAFLEFSAKCTLAAHTNQKIQTVNISVDFLTSSSANDMFAKINIKRMGRRIAFTQAVGWQENAEEPVAIAQSCFRLI